ncbi:hypothetical protein V6K52_19605 [Knoellia sp. S7-12]|uniref:hypothetical protein n=1 Tax=Knoellia sp. S7-12 TaxID=3126698 RepID=UPI003365E8C2
MTAPAPSTRATQAEVAGSINAAVAVPWATVLPLALVLSFADGFWVISMRGAVGAVRSGPGPFTTWWRESGVLLPLYVFAVLGSFTLALRWARSGRRRAPLAAAGLVTAFSAVVGIGHLAAGAAGDFRLQWAHLQVMTSMRGDCPPDCLERLRQDTLGLQLRAVAVGALLLLVTNMGSVVWLSMCRGGQLTFAHVRRAPRHRVRTHDLMWQLRFLLATGLVGAAVIHLAVVPEHLAEWPTAGAFFVVLAAAEVSTAAAVLTRPAAGSLLLATVTSGAPLLLWGWSRLWGLPFGPSAGAPEPVGLPDVAAVALELAALVLAGLLIRRAPALTGRAGSSDHFTRLWTTAVVAVTVIALAATQEGWFDVVPVATRHG